MVNATRKVTRHFGKKEGRAQPAEMSKTRLHQGRKGMSKPTLDRRQQAGRYKVDDDDESATLALVFSWIFFVYFCSTSL
jgi:hypothetical protein